MRRPDRHRRRLLLSAPIGLAGGWWQRSSAQVRPPAPSAAASVCAGAWNRFTAECLQPDGRVIDRDTEALTSTSEGQAYALFFALVADDRARFDRVLDWTRNNLAGGDFSARLPAWQWGRRPDGQWGVLDPNAASDADLWLAYTLFEAARLWQAPALAEQGRVLLSRIAREEVADVPGLGPMLLPGPVGFVSADRRLWRFNPSYSPPHLLRGLARVDPGGPWNLLARQTLRLLRAVCLHGLAPDWAAWQVSSTDARSPNGQWTADPVHGDTGSYDAIRCYLWAGVLPARDPLRAPLLRCLGGLQALARGDRPLPERVSTRVASAPSGEAPAGFDAAVLPFLDAVGDRTAAAARLARLQTLRLPRLRYYDHALLLFGADWAQGRWRCDDDGRLQRFPHSCP